MKKNTYMLTMPGVKCMMDLLGTGMREKEREREREGERETSENERR